jgi:hypothetical protein
MTDLVERYIHQVGRYLPRKERAEIEAELRSQIQDQLDDRYAGTPTEAEVAEVLVEFGHPYRIATSYNGEKYLVGPSLYPFMMMILRYGWVLVPALIIFLNLFGAVVSPPEEGVATLLVETLLSAIQATLSFSAVVILIFAIIQRSGAEFELKEKESTFDPLTLSKVDDPGVVDRVETAFGLAFGTVWLLVALYWLQVGGITLRFNLADPGDVIPFPTTWMILLIVSAVGQLLMNLLVLRQNRWSRGAWLVETALELFGLVCVYFAILEPLFAHISPDLSEIPELIAIILGVIAVLGKGVKLVELWNYNGNSQATLNAKQTG